MSQDLKKLTLYIYIYIGETHSIYVEELKKEKRKTKRYPLLGETDIKATMTRPVLIPEGISRSSSVR